MAEVTLLQINFMGRNGKRLSFVCAGFAYARMVMGNRSYGWYIL